MPAAALTTLSDEERLVRDSVYEFADREIRPLVREMDEHATIPRALIDKLFGLGVMGIEIPEDLGGGGASFFHAVLAVEALSRVDPSIGVLVDVQNTLVINALLRWGTDDLKRRYLPRLASSVGRRLCPVGGWLRQRRLRDGVAGDAARLRRRLGPERAQALDHQRARGGSLHRLRQCRDPPPGTTASRRFSSSAESDGFTVGKKEDKLGIRASSTCELILEDCRVPAANVLGEAGKGYKVAIETLNEGRIGIGAQMIGLARGALDHAIKYIKEREQFGKPIASFQAVQHQIARAATELEAARLMVYNAARLRDAGRPFVTEAAMCKIFSSEVAERVTSLAVNLYGGYGFVKDYPVEKLYRDAKIGQIYEGTSNLQLQTIAKQILG